MSKTRVLEMNASDERGIKVVRVKIKTFAQASIGKSSNSEFPCPPFKMIILDEADSMTGDAQAALRRTIETYSKTTRFCLICNYVSRIIEPLASRCAKYRFKALPVECMLERLKFISEQESLECPEDVYEKILELSGGDLRRAVTLLQSTFNFCGLSASMSPEVVTEVAGALSSNVMDELWAAIRSNSFDQLESVVEDSIVLAGFAAPLVIEQLIVDMAKLTDLTNAQKGKVAQTLAQVDKCLLDGAEEELQLLNGVAAIQRIMHAR